MKQITVISGKGGTGKTTITACLSRLADNYVIADCDVDAADLHLLTNPQIGQRQNFYSGKSYQIDKDKCTACGKCQNICRYQAINEDFVIEHIACEGCGACYFVCPQQAISVKENLAGEYFVSSIDFGKTPFIHANLHIAEDNSGKLVAQVRKLAREKAEELSFGHVLIDGPPGIGCPVNAAIVGVDLTLVVTEPTMSGIHDLERVLDVAKNFEVDSKVVINKFDINGDNTKKIEEICDQRGVQCLAKIPYDKAIVQSLIAGKTILETNPNHQISLEIKKIWQEIK